MRLVFHRSENNRPRRVTFAALLCAAGLVAALAPGAQGKPSPASLKDRLDTLQAELDQATARVEALRTQENDLLFTAGRIDSELRELEQEKIELEDRVVATVRRLYMDGPGGDLEMLLSASSLTDLSVRSEALSRVSELDRRTFAQLERTEERLTALQEQVTGRAQALISTRGRLAEESDSLQARFAAVNAEYKRLQRKLAASRPISTLATVQISRDGLTCPIAAANSFIDSWGFPRSGGRTHEGADLMAEMGSPVVAITDGRITFAGVGETAGNWLILSGDDGHSYWYMHNKENLVTEGRVTVGQQIATVGDTGNAIGGPPHVHFEYHPNGGGPVNPYLLLAGICKGAR